MNRLQQVNGRLLRIWQYVPEIKPQEMAIEGQVELALIAQTVFNRGHDALPRRYDMSCGYKIRRFVESLFPHE
jgi:hypothetical protein